MLYSKIHNPFTQHIVNINSRTGKYILQGYYNKLIGGSGSSKWNIVKKLNMEKSLRLLNPNFILTAEENITKGDISRLLQLLQELKNDNTLNNISNSDLKNIFPEYIITKDDIQKGLELLI